MSPELVTRPPWPDGSFVVDLDALGPLALHDLAALERRSIPSVAVIRGRCEGAALAVACATDLLVAGPDASFGRPGAWTDVVVRRGTGIMGRKSSAYLTMTDRCVGAIVARRWGLVSRIDDDPVAAALETAEVMGARSPVAVATVLHQAHRGAAADYILTGLTGPREPDEPERAADDQSSRRS